MRCKNYSVKFLQILFGKSLCKFENLIICPVGILIQYLHIYMYWCTDVLIYTIIFYVYVVEWYPDFIHKKDNYRRIYMYIHFIYISFGLYIYCVIMFLQEMRATYKYNGIWFALCKSQTWFGIRNTKHVEPNNCEWLESNKSLCQPYKQ